jgi:hypothetical protein
MTSNIGTNSSSKVLPLRASANCWLRLLLKKSLEQGGDLFEERVAGWNGQTELRADGVVGDLCVTVQIKTGHRWALQSRSV